MLMFWKRAPGGSRGCSSQLVQGGVQAVDRPDLQPFDGLARRVGLGDQRRAEAQLGGFAQALLPARRRADLAGQAPSADGAHPARQGPAIGRASWRARVGPTGYISVAAASSQKKQTT